MAHDHHHHDHDHHHHHSHAAGSELTLPQKMEKLFHHWIHHNEDHAATYRQWAGAISDHNKRSFKLVLITVQTINLLTAFGSSYNNLAIFNLG